MTPEQQPDQLRQQLTQVLPYHQRKAITNRILALQKKLEKEARKKTEPNQPKLF